MATRWQQLRRVSDRVKQVTLLAALTVVGTIPYLVGATVPRSAFEHQDERIRTFDLPLWTIAFPLAAVAALAFRKRYPKAVLTVTVGLGVALSLLTGNFGLTSLPTMVALFNLAMSSNRMTSVSAAALTVAALNAPDLIRDPSSWPQLLGTAFWVALAPAVAEAVRNRRAYIAEIEERARQAEETKEEEARRQVAEERVRIARELHDILAHSIAVINVQSGVAAHVIDNDVAHAKTALEHINDASDTALAELKATLDLLRQDEDAAAPTKPVATLRDVDELLVGIRASGLETRTDIVPDTRSVPPEVSMVAYRVLQEALTNVLKHANATSVGVRVAVDQHKVRVEVRDDGVGSEDPPPEGHGRIGMRERVHAVGGDLDDGPTGDGYRVVASLPLDSSRRWT